MEKSSTGEVKREKPKHFGIEPAVLNDDILRAVVAIYYEVAREEEISEISLRSSYSVADLARSHYETNYRLGSTLNQHSQLFVCREGYPSVLEFSFYANHQRQEDEYPASENYHKGKDIKERFATRVDELLLALGVAEPVPS